MMSLRVELRGGRWIELMLDGLVVCRQVYFAWKAHSFAMDALAGWSTTHKKFTPLSHRNREKRNRGNLEKKSYLGKCLPLGIAGH